MKGQRRDYCKVKPKRRYSEGGWVEPAEGDEARDIIERQRSRNEYEEVVAGKRFHDGGVKIPGALKAENDRYMERYKKRRD